MSQGELVEYIQSHPLTSKQINLEAISDLQPLLPLLVEFKDLSSLDLSGNRLKILPQDLSQLSNLQQLNISNNLLVGNISKIVASLKTLPKLNTLGFTFLCKSDEQKLREQLPNLTKINEVRTVRNYEYQSYKKICIERYETLINYQREYLSIEPDGNFKSNYIKQMDEIIRTNGNDENIKQLLFQSIKEKALVICQIIYGGIAQIMRELFQQQKIFIKKQIVNVSGVMNNAVEQLLKREIKRLKKQKSQMQLHLTQMETQNNRLLNMLIGQSKENISKNQHINQTQQSSTNSRKTGRQSSNIKIMNQKQLKDIIEDIYQSKQKFDQNCVIKKLAKVTMQQYLLIYLNQKYGLKVLIQQNHQNIISAIEKYAAQDNDIKVFHKILRNELDEQFRLVQTELKNTAIDLLRVHIQSKNPYKSNNDIQQLLNDHLNTTINEQQYTNIITYLYNEQDSKNILNTISYNLEEQKSKILTNRRKQIKPYYNKIKFNVFMQILLNFQLNNHQNYLYPLLTAFKYYDHNHDGIINQELFIQVISKLCDQPMSLIPTFLDIVDPYETKIITFNQVVKLVANHPPNQPILAKFTQQRLQTV